MIGEAVSHVSPELRAAHPEVPWRAAAAMRNRAVHGYFDIDLDIVWSAAEQDIPARRDDQPNPRPGTVLTFSAQSQTGHSVRPGVGGEVAAVP